MKYQLAKDPNGNYYLLEVDREGGTEILDGSGPGTREEALDKVHWSKMIGGVVRLKGKGAALEIPAPEPTFTAKVVDAIGQSIPKLEAQLATGELDPLLATVLEAEKVGENRDGAVSAIEARTAKIR